MQRIINFRGLVVIFVGAIIGVIFSLQILQKNMTFFIVCTILALLLTLFVVLTSVFSKNRKFAFANKFIICFLIGFVLFVGIGVVNFDLFNKNLAERENVEISCRVFSVNEQSDYYYFVLEDCVLNGNEKVDGKIGFTAYSDDVMPQICVGDHLKFDANLIVNYVLKDGKFNSYYYRNDLKYYCYTTLDTVETEKGTMHFDEKCREKVKNILFENLSYNNASIAYASIFGDKTLLDQNVVDAFSISGTAHLLCVSGLHVGFLATLLYFVLNLCKVKKKYSFCVVAIVLLIYSYLCGFSPSVVRASLMSIVFAFADASGKVRYDSLSSLAFAGLLILLFKPFYVFDVGFQLSFSACFGIILLAPLFVKFFKRIGFYNKISNAFCITLSAQIGTFPILFHNFKSLSFLSVIANIFIVPLFSFVFMLTLVFLLINLILPFGFLFKIVEMLLNFVVFITKGFGAVQVCVFETFTSPIILNLLFYFALICVSGFVNLSNKVKLVCLLSCTILICVACLLQFMPTVFKTNYIINSQSESFTIITNSSNQKALINCGKFDENDVSLLKTDTFDMKIFDFDIFILPYYNQQMQSGVSEICNHFGVKFLYVTQNIDELGIKNLFQNLKCTQIITSEDVFESYSNFTFKINSSVKSVWFNVLDNDINFSMFLCDK
ncbi:MAG: ComEC/Rec2 family competence protein, partial [Christensenellales bacterium]